MKVSEGTIRRVFTIRLEDGERLPEAIESLAAAKEISRGVCLLVGGIRGGGRIVSGPEREEARPIVPALFQISGVHEILGAGTLFPDEDGRPRLHLHAALGRKGETRTGCIRPGIEVWQVGEVILWEIHGGGGVRRKDPATGFDLLET